jgi:prolipoprotein diacylglyceryl transferase
MANPIIWNVNPVLITLGPLSVRYYGICFGLAIATAFTVWYARVRRFGESIEFAEQLLYVGVPAVLIGGRLGYCLFYAPKTFLAEPWRIVAIWQGGIVSHGVAIGITCAVWWMSRRHHVSFLRLGDYLTPAVALAVGWIRVGNFFNSEIIGRPASVPWAVVFARHDQIPRHPAQLYDLAMGPLTYLVLREVERRNVRPIGSGLISGTFLAVYFGMRLYVETFKDFYLEQVRELPPFSTIESLLGVKIHTGQWLSLLPCLIGIALIIRALRRRVP